jgi:hypothetical protein
MTLHKHTGRPGASRWLAAALLSALCASPIWADTPAPIDAAFSREVIVYAGEPAAVLTQAHSRESVLYNSEPVTPLTQSYSREAEVYNSEPATIITQAYSREAALYNSEPVTLLTQSYSREAVAYVSESPIVDSFSREAVVFNGYYLPEALEAVRIAGGLKTATPAQMDRFQMAMQRAAQNRISLPVAAEIMRIALRLQ